MTEVEVSDNHYDEMSVEADESENKGMLSVMKVPAINKWSYLALLQEDKDSCFSVDRMSIFLSNI